MATRKISSPPRPWSIDSLLVLGKKEGTKANYMKAVPLLILEKWVREGRKEEDANYVTTKDVENRLVESGVKQRPFKPKGAAVLLASLTRIQRSRNLTCPKLIENVKEGL